MERRSEVPQELIDQINEAQAETEKEAMLGRLCNNAFATEGQMEAQGITQEIKDAARAELAEQGYDLEHAQMLVDNQFSAGQIRSKLRLKSQ